MGASYSRYATGKARQEVPDGVRKSTPFSWGELQDLMRMVSPPGDVSGPVSA
jgi:hypothetical protein